MRAADLGEISHLASLPGILQVVAQQFDPVLGHYGDSHPLEVAAFARRTVFGHYGAALLTVGITT